MKKYTVNVHFDVVCTVEVEANNETDAKEIAEEIAWETDPSVFTDYDLIGSCITNIEDV